MLKDPSTHPHTLKSAPCLSLSSLLRLRVRLGTIVAQPVADGEVSPEGASQVPHPLVVCPGSQLLQPPVKVRRPQAPVGWASLLPALPPPAGDTLLCSCQGRRRQRERERGVNIISHFVHHVRITVYYTVKSADV